MVLGHQNSDTSNQGRLAVGDEKINYFSLEHFLLRNKSTNGTVPPSRQRYNAKTHLSASILTLDVECQTLPHTKANNELFLLNFAVWLLRSRSSDSENEHSAFTLSG